MLNKQDNLTIDLISTDIDDQSIMLNGWDQKYIQLETGPFEARVSSLNLSDSINIIRKYTNRRMRKCFVSPGKSIRLVAILPGSDTSLFRGHKVFPGDLLILRPNIDSELICHGKLDIVIIELESNLSFCQTEETYINHLNVKDVLHKQITNNFSEKICTAFLNKKINIELFYSICAPAIRALYHKGLTYNKNDNECIVTKVVNFFECCLENVDELPKISDVATYFGVSERAIEYGFARKYGVSPIQYFKFLRLHGARRDIRVGQLSVTNVAMKWGFNHLGRFSGIYRDTFGELPSQTK